jgi:asparagine synthase (glutamine-hydrolysing)
MCGIAGVSGRDAVSRVQKLLPLLVHRGPDGEGIWSKGSSLALGHRRLAINDLSSSGKQPMVSDDERTAIVVNGEIYNYRELREDLEKLGTKFNSTSDSEVVLHAWNYWGKDCFIKFNGMFAIAIYDCRNDLLVLARDRLGIKPLYYSISNRDLVFASEIKAVIAGFPGTKPQIDPTGLNQYLTYQNYFGDRTLYEGIKLLQPGQLLLLRPGGKEKLESYWSLSFSSENPETTFSQAVDQYQQVLTESVQRHLMSDVPVASYLSAGFDSASVANRAAHIGSPPVCFTGSFPEGGWYDETSMARTMAKRSGSEHVSVSIDSSDLPRVLDNLIRSLDEPRMGMGAFPQYCVAEQVAKTHKVILTGHGGDELFSGYPVFKLVQILESLKQSPINLITQLRNLRFAELPHLAYFSLGAFRSNSYRQYFPILNSASNLQAGLRPEWASPIKDLHAEDELVALDHACEGDAQVLFSHYLKSYLNGLLVVEDKLSMAHSLESRTPMLDNHLLDLSLSIPQKIKMHQGNLKAVIKEGGRDWLPGELYEQPKRGFPTPLRYWLRGNLRDWFISRISGPESGLRKLFLEGWLNQVCYQYLDSPKKNIRVLDEIHSHRMWQLLCLESWLRKTS